MQGKCNRPKTLANALSLLAYQMFCLAFRVRVPRFAFVACLTVPALDVGWRRYRIKRILRTTTLSLHPHTQRQKTQGAHTDRILR